MRSSRVLALDVGASRLTCVLWAGGPRRLLRLEELASEPIEAAAATEPEWVAEVARAVRILATRVRYRGEVRIALPGHLAFTKCVRTPAIAGAKRRRVVEFEAAQNIPHPLAEVWWDHQVIDPRAADLEILLMAAKRSAISALEAALDVPGWRLEAARPGAAALHDALRLNYPETSGAVLLASVGARSTHLLVCGPNQFWLRTVALGGTAVTQAIATQLDVDFARAEVLKRAAATTGAETVISTAERTAFESAAAQFRGRLQLEIARTLAGFAQHRPGESVRQCYLAGGGARLPALADFLRERVGLPVERFYPLRRVSPGPSKAVRWEDEAGVGIAVGLAADLIAPSGVAGNLLPPEVRRRAVRRRHRRWWLAAAALFVATLLPLTGHFHRSVVAAQAQLLERQAELRAVRAVAQRNAENAARLEQVRAELAALATLSDARGYWVAFLADLQARLGEVEDVWLDQLAVVENASGGGNAPNPGASDGGLRLVVSGRLLEVKHPHANVGEEGYARARKLLARLAASPFVIAIGEERFDAQEPAILRFSCQLTTKRPGGLALR